MRGSLYRGVRERERERERETRGLQVLDGVVIGQGCVVVVLLWSFGLIGLWILGLSFFAGVL